MKKKDDSAIIQITGGSLRGLKIHVHLRENLRPTRSKVREAVFQIWAEYIVGSMFLDPFAGSGAIVLEALSRGADEIHASDINPETLFDLRKRFRDLQKKYPERIGWERIVVSSADFREALSDHFTVGRKFDLVYLDPPYHSDFGIEAIKLITRYELLKPDGRIILEVAKREKKNIENALENMDCFMLKNYTYGDSYLYHLALYDEEEPDA